jgi:hypothetical protein
MQTAAAPLSDVSAGKSMLGVKPAALGARRRRNKISRQMLGYV